MTTPIQLLRAKKTEITDEYNRVLRSKYGNDSRSEKQMVARELFNNSKGQDLDRIKIELDKYNEAINSLMAIRSGTF